MKREQIPASDYKPIRLTREAPMQVTPRFVYLTNIGNQQLEGIHTDLMLVTMLSSQRVPSCLHAQSTDIGDKIRNSISDAHFDGRCGQKLLVETELPGVSERYPRRLLITGIGSPHTFCTEKAYTVFGTLIDEALELRVKTITVPFVANRGTGACTNLKSMAYQLKVALTERFAKLTETPPLEEIQILCSKQAKRFIEMGLAIPVDLSAEEDSDEDCGCS